MDRAEEIQLIDAAVAAGKVTRYPTGHSSDMDTTKCWLFGGRDKADVARRASAKRRTAVVTRASTRAAKG